jgi:uncharacterized protein YqjF (DUF2071 family)
MAQSWHQLLFAHWPVPIAAIRSLVPPSLTIDTFAGEAFIGVVPFRMSGVRPRAMPSIPGLSAFPELNVRTYVVADGKPGVWFFSLDAANVVAVRLARLAFHLPYFHARMSLRQSGDQISYQSERIHRGAPPARFVSQYRPTGATYRSQPGTQDHWLTERYCLYAEDRHGNLYRADIHHEPWPLQPASAEIQVNTMVHGIDLPTVKPLLHYADRLDVQVWPLVRVGAQDANHAR